MEPFSAAPIKTAEDYRARLPELEAYLSGNWLTNMANFSAFVFHTVPSLNWAGFYLFDGAVLRLGPFVGKPACTEIKPGRGVCGTAFAQKKTLVVPDVETFPGHIACDSVSRSELVFPLLDGDSCFGVLDLDSPELNRFLEADEKGLEIWAQALTRKLPRGLFSEKPWA